jgi:DNA helicase-2/ATP-dependent DNA helicase PcrA
MTAELVLGPPGTGKTTYLLDQVNFTLDKGAEADSTAFISFTTKGAIEGSKRIIESRDNSSKDFRFFRTIHSMCFLFGGFTRSEVIKSDDYKQLGMDIGYDINANIAFDSGAFVGESRDSDLLNVVEQSRIRCIDLKEAYDKLEVDCSYEDIQILQKHYQLYKDEHCVVDYTDMLEWFLAADIPNLPKWKLLCVDEAQDLSQLQWRVVDKLMQRTEHTIIAGDDDQAIYRWAGADVEHFLNLGLSTSVLSQSYRLPSEIYTFANAYISQIGHRYEKEWRPKNEPGTLDRVISPFDLDMSEGEWLILVRHKYQIPKLLELWDIFPGKEKDIKLATIHGAKGGECENVVVLTDMATRAYDNWLEDPDDEIRVFYVACTRAKENLYIVEPQTRQYIDI